MKYVNINAFVFPYFSSYDGNGQICTDTNECALGLASCAQDAECKNTEGSFRCECKEGFNGDGEFCLGEFEYIILLSRFLVISSPVKGIHRSYLQNCHTSLTDPGVLLWR